MTCNQCGQTNNVDSRFCTSCGCPLAPASDVQPLALSSIGRRTIAPILVLSVACALFASVALLLLFGVIRPIVFTRGIATTQPDAPDDLILTDEYAPVTVCLLIADSSADWYARQSDDITVHLENAGYVLAVSDAGGDAETQMTQLEDAVVTGADVIVLEPVLAEACIPALELARESGIGIVLLGRSSKLSDLSDTTLDTGGMVARRLTDWLHVHW